MNRSGITRRIEALENKPDTGLTAIVRVPRIGAKCVDRLRLPNFA
jgi:hypothetical protein